MKRKIFFGLFFIIAVSCSKDQQYVPNVYVNLVIYVNEPQNSALATVGGWKYFPGGNRGVIVYRKGVTEFMAYERTCPYLPEQSNSFVSVDTTNNAFMKDASCGSTFLLSTGENVGGAAVIPLRVFTTLFDGTILTVTN
ncbi:MAG TPA: hypothetical protein VL651_07740 [Bacteroidia bacterium]|jgi:hypothetical protein|nr:hypothetical protein [Bacteroidia bacterium]